MAPVLLIDSNPTEKLGMREIDEQYRSHWKLVSNDKYTYKVNLKMLPGIGSLREQTYPSAPSVASSFRAFMCFTSCLPRNSHRSIRLQISGVALGGSIPNCIRRANLKTF